MTELGLSFMAGLAGSGHCLGMCGGILAAMAMAAPEVSAGQRLRLNLAYHLGRIITYSLLGLLAGAIAQEALFTSLKPHLYWLFLLANAMVVLIGLATACGLRRFSIAILDGTGAGLMSGVLGRASRQATTGAFLLAGLVMGLLPCGLVYGVLISAATGGSWLQGGGMMLAFGLGTLPALLAYGQVATSLGAISNSMFLRILGLCVAALGVWGILKTLKGMGLIQAFHLW